MNDVKLIALDLDGTTLSHWGISEKTISTLEEAIRSGVHVVIATGRTFTSLPEDVFRIKGLEYVITSNGAHITYLPEGRTIYSNCAAGSVIRRISFLLEENRDFPVEVFTEGRAYIDRAVYEDLKANGSDFMSVEYVIKTRSPVDGIYDFLREKSDKVENINVHFRFQEDKRRFWDILVKQEGITVTSSFVSNIEIGGATTSKAEALSSLCRILKIGEEHVMACGDSPNDISMLRAAGLGIAMGNAEEEVKEAADFVTAANTEDGVAKAVEHFVLGRKIFQNI